MFKSDVFIDFSVNLRDEVDWKIETIRDIEYLPDISAFTVEPTNGLLAVGTRHGNILLFGSPAAVKIVKVPRNTSVKFLHIAVLLFKLLCVDDDGNLHVWDIGELGPPKRLASVPFREPIQCIAISPSHSHAFLALDSGKVATYDILCQHKSPYEIPNIWKMNEKALSESLPVPIQSDSPFAIDLVLHPRDLNLLFIAYSGGVVLYDITERRPIRFYVLVIPPGAPGGTGYSDPSILQPRCPPVSAISVHASGHLFVVGYVDGCFAFWATDDVDHPLAVRTVESLHVDVPDAASLDKVLSSDGQPTRQTPAASASAREPIFKLAWSSFGSVSDPWGKSLLTILGGQSGASQHSISSIPLQQFVIASPSTPAGRHPIHPDIRSSLVKPLNSTDAYAYSTPGLPQDFILIPKDTPHCGCVFDPIGIIIVHQGADGSRSLQANAFPPAAFNVTASLTSPSNNPVTNSSSTSQAEITSSLEALRLASEQRVYELPTALWVGLNAVNDGDIIRLESDAYDTIIRCKPDNTASLGKGGIAWVDYDDRGHTGDLRGTKTQSRRLLVTHHRDLTIRFQDISPQLLMGSRSTPFTAAYPEPLSFLTIELTKLLVDWSIVSHSRPINLPEVEIQSMQLTSESLECVVVLRSGHVLVYGFSEQGRNQRSPAGSECEIVTLTHIASPRNCFQPVLLVDNTWGRVTTCDLSNIGFLAIGYDSGALLIVDMRKPSIILRESDGDKRKHHSIAPHLHKDENSRKIQSLRWFVCRTEEDPLPRARLVVSLWSGATRIFATFQKSGGWTIESTLTRKAEGVEQPLPRCTYVIDSSTSADCLATKTTFRKAINWTSTDRERQAPHCLWITAGQKGAKCIQDFSGQKVGKVEWGKGREVECVELVNKKGALALVAIMETREVLIYSVPYLVPLHTFRLPKQPSSVICLDDHGDYVDWTFDEQQMTISRFALGTLFAMRRVFDEPIVDFASSRRLAPPLPQAVPLGPATMLGSFFNFKRSISGDQMDALLAGPNRPLDQAESTSAAVNSQWQGQMQTRATELATQVSQTSGNVYNSLAAAINERGEHLGSLDDSFKSMSEGAQRMAEKAKRLATEQTAKGWFSFGRGTGL